MAAEEGHEASPRAGMILIGWMTLTLGLQAALWISGVRPIGLQNAVEVGAERSETLGIGEQADDVVRKAIRLQQDTLPFWSTLAMIGDFVAGPLSLAIRATLVATLFSGWAALRSRPIGFESAFRSCALAQGFWVLGLAVRVGLSIGLRRTEVETSPTLLLAPGIYPAAAWVALRQVDPFALLGWLALARGGWKRGQVGLIGAILVCLALWSAEAIMAIVASLFLGAGMRLTLMPEGLS